MAVTIKEVNPKSRAFKKGADSGDVLISINGNESVDVLDYRFYQVNKKLELVIK